MDEILLKLPAQAKFETKAGRRVVDHAGASVADDQDRK
jgi:hypothetical protein